MMTQKIQPDMYGSDAGHDFRVLNVSRNQVRIEYLDSGEETVFCHSMFNWENGELCL
jgi:hypothetical protein